MWNFSLLQIVLIGAGFILLADLAIHLIYAIVALNRFESRPPFRVQPPGLHAPLPEPLSLLTQDRLRLQGGIYLPEDAPLQGVVIFCPETAGPAETATNYAQALLDSGFAVVSFNFRNQAPSESRPGYRSSFWLTENELRDVHAVLDVVHTQPQFQGLPVGLMGVSRGGAAALAAAADRCDVDAVWAQGAFSNHGLATHHVNYFIEAVVGRWGRFIPRWHVAVTIECMLQIAQWRYGARFIRLENALPQLCGRPVQFVSGKKDMYVPPRLTRQLQALIGDAKQPACWEVAGAKHNTERLVARDEYDQRIVEFFQQIVRTSPLRQQTVSLTH